MPDRPDIPVPEEAHATNCAVWLNEPGPCDCGRDDIPEELLRGAARAAEEATYNGYPIGHACAYEAIHDALPLLAPALRKQGAEEERERLRGEGFTEWELGVIRTYALRQLDALSKPEAESEVGQRWLDLLNRAALLASRLSDAALDTPAPSEPRED